MECTNKHSHQDHTHGPNCGHTAIQHGDHIDYLYEGHLHHPHDDHCDEHSIEISAINPEVCSPISHCKDHIHGPGCGHEAIPHGDHVDYIVNGRLHHVHNGHCDDHGPIGIVNGN